jgi:hypothetical protein
MDISQQEGNGSKEELLEYIKTLEIDIGTLKKDKLEMETYHKNDT